MDPFLGQIQAFGFNFAPRGWAKCDGQLLPISSNSALFSLLGTTYGGDGRTTFGLPDLQGRVSIHQGRGPGLSAYRVGQKGGQENVTLTEFQMPIHHHELHAKADSPNTQKPNGMNLAGANIYSSSGNDTTLDTAAMGSKGGGGEHENRAPYLVLNWCIAIVGIFPSR